MTTPAWWPGNPRARDRSARASARPGCDCSPGRWRRAPQRHVLGRGRLGPVGAGACCRAPERRRRRSLVGHRVRQPPPPANTICEGLKTALGEIPWAIIKEHVQSIEVVDDDQVLHAWRAVLRKLIIIEPACGCSRRRRFDGVFGRLGYRQSRPHPDRGQHRSGPDPRIPQPNRLISR